MTGKNYSTAATRTGNARLVWVCVGTDLLSTHLTVEIDDGDADNRDAHEPIDRNQLVEGKGIKSVGLRLTSNVLFQLSYRDHLRDQGDTCAQWVDERARSAGLRVATGFSSFTI